MDDTQLTEELKSLTKALSGFGGLGVDEKTLVSAIGERRPEKRSLFRRGSSTFFKPNGSLEVWNEDQIRELKFEFARFKNVVLLWTMHPWERDARWAHYVLHKAHPFTILVELACTRSSEELLGARRAYHDLFHHSLEEDVAYHVKESHSNNVVLLWTMHPWERDARWAHHVLHKAHPFTILVELACTRSSEELLGARRAYHALFHHFLEEDVAYHVKESHSNLLIGLVSAYRYEGPHVNEEIAKSEAKALGNSIKNGIPKKPAENEEVIRILTTRSKLHLKLVFKHYKEMYGKPVQEDLTGGSCLQETVECLDSPPIYFSKIIYKALKDGADKTAKEALTRVIVSRAEVDMKQIKEVYQKLYGAQVEDVIEKNTHGNYKDALLSLVARKD